MLYGGGNTSHLRQAELRGFRAPRQPWTGQVRGTVRRM